MLTKMFKRCLGFELIILQKFECVVDEVTNQSVWMQTADLTNVTYPDEVIEMPLNEFTKRQRVKLKPGTVFYWDIGTQHTIFGSKNFSKFRFPKN